MLSFKLAAPAGVLLLLSMTSGCSTYYEDLMTNQQLIAADCSSLAEEEMKIQSNINASNEGSGVNIFGAVAMAFLEGEAASSTGATYDPNNSSAMAFADGAGSTAQLAADWEKKKSLIGQLRAKKGC